MSKRKKAGQKEIEELAKAIENIAPKKRQRKGRIGTVVSPDQIGVETRFKKGHKRPGPGRPSTTPMRDALRKTLLSKFPPKFSKAMGIKKGITWAEAVSLTSLYDTVKAPEPAKFTAYAAESDGPLPTEISGPGGAPIPMDVNVNDKLAVVAGRLRDRLAGRTKSA